MDLIQIQSEVGFMLLEAFFDCTSHLGPGVLRRLDLRSAWYLSSSWAGSLFISHQMGSKAFDAYLSL